MNFLSLFSGIGGFDLAFQRAGFDCVGMCEIDKKAQDVLRRHFPDAPLFDDVKKVGKATHGRKTVDIIVGGFPCQDLSVAGKRAGLAGERSGLWFEFARIIDELEPRGFVIENVPGLLSSDKGRDFAIIIQWLAERGYGVAWRVLDAQYFGLAQRRKRVFIVGSFGDGRAAEVLFESEGMSRNPRESREGAQEARPVSEVAYPLRANPSHSGDKGDGGINSTLVMAHGQANAEIVRDGSPSLTRNHEAPIVAFTADGDGSDAGEDISPALEHGASSPSGHGSYKKKAIAFKERGGGGHGGKGYIDRQDSGFSVGGYQQRVWEMSHPDEAVRENGELAPTLQQRMGTGGNQVPLVGIRRLTPVECERLQGFPDGWTDGQADSVRYRQLGNAVAVPVVEWLAKRIMAKLG